MAKVNRQTLNSCGLRYTGQRALLLELIRQGEGHLDADELYRRARQKQPRLSLSTVYRALQMFKKQGLVEELHFDDAHHHYELKPPDKHHHLVCLGCGRIFEFQYPTARQIKKNVNEARDFRIIDAELRVTGYCSQCRESRQ